MLTALDPDTPVLHPELGDNKMMFERVAEKGDVDASRRCSHVVEGTFDFGRHTGVTLEPRTMVSSWDSSEKHLTVYYGGQAVHMIQVLSKHLGIPERDIRVIAQDCGGSYGIKATFTAMSLRRPCCRSCSAARSAIAPTGSSPSYPTFMPTTSTDGKMGIDTNGKIIAFEFDDITAAGAYSAYPRTSCVEANQVLNIAEAVPTTSKISGPKQRLFSEHGADIAVSCRGPPHGDRYRRQPARQGGGGRRHRPDEIRRRNLISDDAYPASSRRPVSRCMTYLIRHTKS